MGSMKNFVIAKHFSVNEAHQVYLLQISENTGRGNRKLIPQTQLDEISTYRSRQDVEKRILSRAFLYEYLAGSWGINDFESGFNQHKKPFLKAAPGIDFSFSYADDYLLVGLSRGGKVGVDIESINFKMNVHEPASEIMCPAELEKFRSYPPGSVDQFYYFFHVFSAKESIVKCFGTGLYFNVTGLNTVDTTAYSYMGARYTLCDLGLWRESYVLSLCYEHNRTILTD
jgi:4'-phosphopantetheinyl transferase